MNIKQALTAHLSKFTSAPFLFIGAGMSRRYLNLDNWDGLLRRFASLTPYSFEYYSSSCDGNYALMATKIANSFHEVWWSNSDYEENRARFKEFCSSRESALKIEVAQHMMNIEEKLTNDPGLMEEIDLLKQATIDGAITTNYDCFLEYIFQGFKPYIGQSEMIFSSFQGIGEIYKIHGCCTNPNSIVLTEGDYAQFNQRNPYLAAKLITIFTEHPIIFAGYSLNDPNVTEILKSISSCLNNNTIELLRDRLIFLKWHSSPIEETFERNQIFVNNYPLPILTVNLNSYIEVFTVLSNIKRQFPAKLLRKLKESVYELVVNEKAENKLYVQDINEATDSDEVEIVFGVGAISKIKDVGYKRISRKRILEDILYNNQDFDAKNLLFNTIAPIPSSNYTPIFKYIRELGIKTREDLSKYPHIPDKILSRVYDVFNIHYFQLQSYHKHGNECKNSTLSLKDYANKFGIKEALRYFAYFPDKFTTSQEIESFALAHEECLHSPNNEIATQYAKLVCFLDLKKYGLKE